MINLPFKTIELGKGEFIVREITHPSQYNFNTEFESLFKNNLDYKVVIFRLPLDCQVSLKQYFTLRPIECYYEFWHFSQIDKVMSVICRHSNWDNLETLKFGYYYLPNELKEIQSKIEELQKEYNEKVKELMEYEEEIYNRDTSN